MLFRIVIAFVAVLFAFMSLLFACCKGLTIFRSVATFMHKNNKLQHFKKQPISFYDTQAL